MICWGKTDYIWYGHLRRKEEEDIIKKTLEMEVKEKLPKWRPRKSWMDNVREDAEEKVMDLGRTKERE